MPARRLYFNQSSEYPDAFVFHREPCSAATGAYSPLLAPARQFSWHRRTALPPVESSRRPRLQGFLEFPVLTETARTDIVIVLTRPLVLFDVEYTDRAQIGSGVKAAAARRRGFCYTRAIMSLAIFSNDRVIPSGSETVKPVDTRVTPMSSKRLIMSRLGAALVVTSKPSNLRPTLSHSSLSSTISPLISLTKSILLTSASTIGVSG